MENTYIVFINFSFWRFVEADLKEFYFVFNLEIENFDQHEILAILILKLPYEDDSLTITVYHCMTL